MTIRTSCRQDDILGCVQGGFTHGFVMEFETVEDLRFYVEKDPAHQDFIRSMDGIVKEARVVDFESGVF